LRLVLQLPTQLERTGVQDGAIQPGLLAVYSLTGKRRALIHQSATAGSSMPPNFTIAASTCLILSFIATQRILLHCPEVLRRLRVLPHLRKA
jgi:hypothetical protein